MTPTHYDLVIIGSGPAGQKAAFAAAKLGKRVALVERDQQIGGVCIHTGTIPSKAMREAVLHLTGIRERSLYGDSYAVKEHITMADLLYRCQHVVRGEVDVLRGNLCRRNGVKIIWGKPQHVLDPHTVRVVRQDGPNQQSVDLKAKNVLIAVGTEPAATRPMLPFSERAGSSTARSCFRPGRELPSSLIIVGGGVIGVEYACMLAAVDVTVTLCGDATAAFGIRRR